MVKVDEEQQVSEERERKTKDKGTKVPKTVSPRSQAYSEGREEGDRKIKEQHTKRHSIVLIPCVQWRQIRSSRHKEEIKKEYIQTEEQHTEK